MNQAGPTCIATFFALQKQLYGGDANCSATVQQAFSAVNADQCPYGGSAKGSTLQLCMNKTAVRVFVGGLRG